MFKLLHSPKQFLDIMKSMIKFKYEQSHKILSLVTLSTPHQCEKNAN